LADLQNQLEIHVFAVDLRALLRGHQYPQNIVEK